MAVSRHCDAYLGAKLIKIYYCSIINLGSDFLIIFVSPYSYRKNFY